MRDTSKSTLITMVILLSIYCMLGAALGTEDVEQAPSWSTCFIRQTARQYNPSVDKHILCQIVTHVL